jgi:hypothetical protein
LRNTYILFENPEGKRKLGVLYIYIWKDNIKILRTWCMWAGFIWFRIDTISGIL